MSPASSACREIGRPVLLDARVDPAIAGGWLAAVFRGG
jgi:hypothetical protein